MLVKQESSRIRGVVANYLASQARDPGIDSHQHLKDSWHIWRHLRNGTVFSCNLRCMLIFLHGCSRTYRVASLRAGPVGRISYNLYFDCKHVRYVTCDFNKRIYFTLILCLMDIHNTIAMKDIHHAERTGARTFGIFGRLRQPTLSCLASGGRHSAVVHSLWQRLKHGTVYRHMSHHLQRWRLSNAASKLNCSWVRTFKPDIG